MASRADTRMYVYMEAVTFVHEGGGVCMCPWRIWISFCNSSCRELYRAREDEVRMEIELVEKFRAGGEV